MVHSLSGWMRGVQVKLWDPLRTRAIPERLKGVFTTRRYTNPRLPYLLPSCTSSTQRRTTALSTVYAVPSLAALHASETETERWQSAMTWRSQIWLGRPVGFPLLFLTRDSTREYVNSWVGSSERAFSVAGPPTGSAGHYPQNHHGHSYFYKKVKSFPSHMGPWGGADLRFLYSPQPDTSLHWEATNTGLVYRAACLFTPQLSPVPSYTAWWQRHYHVFLCAILNLFFSSAYPYHTLILL